MFSSKNIRATVLLASATLLSTSPLIAAIRTKPSAPAAKPRPAISSAHLGASKTHKTASLKAHTVVARKGGLKAVAAKPKSHGQQAIDTARALEIQQALIREHYLNGEATGEWDQATREALTRFQGDNHWQTKILPDARALIKLGLGPSQQNLLNPESAAMSPSYQPGFEKSASGGSN